MKKNIKKILSSLYYPYICSFDTLVSGYTIRFHINNPVEKFRLQELGGEREHLEAVLAKLLPDDVIYDVGASVGAWSIPAAVKANTGKVVSFEPDPENRERLNKNYALNGLTNHLILPVALGDRPGTDELFTAGSAAASPSLRPVNKILTSIKVRIERVDDLISRKEIPVPTLVKIDVEGAEMMALQGMSGLLRSEEKPHTLLLEVHPRFLPAFGTNLTSIFQFLIGNGYELENLAKREDQIICTWVRC